MRRAAFLSRPVALPWFRRHPVRRRSLTAETQRAQTAPGGDPVQFSYFTRGDNSRSANQLVAKIDKVILHFNVG